MRWPHLWHSWIYRYVGGYSLCSEFQYRECAKCKKIQRRWRRNFSSGWEKWKDK